MHRQLLFQVPDLFLEPLDLQSRIHHRVDRRLVGDLHHARGKFESGRRLRQVPRLRPNVRDHDCLAVASDRVAQEVCQFRLAVRNVAALFAGKRQHNLLQETERLVDEAGLFEDEAFRARLLRHLAARQVHQVQLRENDFIR